MHMLQTPSHNLELEKRINDNPYQSPRGVDYVDGKLISIFKAIKNIFVLLTGGMYALPTIAAIHLGESQGNKEIIKNTSRGILQGAGINFLVSAAVHDCINRADINTYSYMIPAVAIPIVTNIASGLYEFSRNKFGDSSSGSHKGRYIEETVGVLD